MDETVKASEGKQGEGEETAGEECEGGGEEEVEEEKRTEEGGMGGLEECRCLQLYNGSISD